MDGVTHHVAARACVRFRGVDLAEAFGVRAGEGVVCGQLKGGGGDSARILGFMCLASQ